MEEITKEQLIAAAEDLNKVLKLEPPIVTAFETNARGAAKNSAEGKFMNELKAEIISVSEGQDSETEKFDLQIGDIPLLQPETVEIIKTLSPASAERLAAIIDAPAPETQSGGKTPSAPPAPKEKKATKSQLRAEFLQKILSEAPVDKKTIADKLQKDFGDSETEARYQTNIALQYLTVFGAVKEEAGRFSVA